MHWLMLCVNQRSKKMFCIKYEEKYLTYHELPGLYLDSKFYTGEEPVSEMDMLNGLSQSVTCQFHDEKLAEAAMDTEEFRYLCDDPDYGFNKKRADFKIVLAPR